MVETNERGEPEYQVGYKRPPTETQFKSGQRANPKGRPPGSPNLKTVVERALKRKIPVRRGDKVSEVTTMEAMCETFALKAAQGDRHAAGVVINLATKSGILGARNDATQTTGKASVIPVTTRVRASDACVEGIDPNLLSRDDQIDLSRIAEQIDAGGDVIALGGEDFVRLKQIMNKGRGKNVVPKADDDLDQAA